MERASRSDTSTLDGPTSPSIEPTKLRAASSAVAVSKVGTGHTRPVMEVDVHLQKAVAGAGDGRLGEVQADAPAASRWDRQGGQRAGWSASTT